MTAPDAEMTLLTVTAAELAYGHVPLLAGVDLTIAAGERIGLIGRNGTGKTSLLRVLAGQRPLDAGRVVRATGLSVGLVAQEPSFETGLTVFDAVADGLPDAGLLARYERLSGAPPTPESLAELAALQERLDADGAWAFTHRIDNVLSRLALSADAPVDHLSGGNRKRVALARALVGEPDLLLLDEPTNHLDIDSIEWLESLLIGHPGAVLVISHDRRFLERVVTRIVELDRGALRSYPGSFEAYQRRRADELSAETGQQARFDRLLSQEEAWIRQGVEARRTRNEGRVRRLEALRRERAARRERIGDVRFALDAGERSGKLVAEFEQVSKRRGERLVLDRVDLIVQRGDRLGIIGANGSGKTTMLRLLLGELEPDSGAVRLGTQREIAYFDQLRAQLDDDATVAETISPGSDWLQIGEQRMHLMSYLGRFLFAAERARSPVRSLSGGERNRLLLARLFARPANLLVLDEPTNDLDIETLELLEELLADYPGTVLLVSHDRAFLDGVVTQTIASLGNGRWQEYAGGYSDYIAARGREPQPRSQPRQAAGPAADAPLGSAARAQPVSGPAGAAPPRPKLSYKERRELDALPERIAALEAEQTTVQSTLADPSLWQRPAGEIRTLQERHGAIESELLECLERWELLETKAG